MKYRIVLWDGFYWPETKTLWWWHSVDLPGSPHVTKFSTMAEGIKWIADQKAGPSVVYEE